MHTCGFVNVCVSHSVRIPLDPFPQFTTSTTPIRGPAVCTPVCMHVSVSACPCPRAGVRAVVTAPFTPHPQADQWWPPFVRAATDQRILPPSTEKCWGITFWNSACGTSLTWQSLWANTAPLSFSWANAGYLKGNSQSSRHQVRGNREFPEMSMTCWLAAKWIHGRGAKCLAFVSRFSGIRAFFCPRMDTYSTASRLFEAGKRMST